jgi:hypothetical protein
VVGLERGGEHLGRVDAQAGEQLGIRTRDPGRRAPQAVAIRVLADGDEDLPDGRLDPRQVDSLFDPGATYPPVDQAGGQVIQVGGVVGVRLGAAP